MVAQIKSRLSEANVPVPDILTPDAVALIHSQPFPDGKEALFIKGVDGYPLEEYSIWMLNTIAKTLKYLGQARPISKSAG
jgi:hypothetical protein